MKLKNETKDKVLAPAGVHNARCIAVRDLGTHEETFTDKKGKKKTTKARKVQIGWELVNESHVFSEEKGEQNFTIYKDYTMSLGDTSNLGKAIASWTGKKIAKNDEFDLLSLKNFPCQIQIVHKVAKTSGNTYTDVVGIMPPPKGKDGKPQPVDKAENKFTSLSLEPDEFDQEAYDALPDWLREKIANSDEYKAMFLEEEKEEEAEEEKPKGKGKTSAAKGGKGKKEEPPF